MAWNPETAGKPSLEVAHRYRHFAKLSKGKSRMMPPDNLGFYSSQRLFDAWKNTDFFRKTTTLYITGSTVDDELLPVLRAYTPPKLEFSIVFSRLFLRLLSVTILPRHEEGT